ncbi:MAG TPA: GNAT family N-acetyltransferase [Acidimicrobiales bacterium]|jgi:GNAT superfamily N-acetyltransferase|nr:GNAT family N-acetyltransferase [Acidimicrobiales bacterium]
MDACVRLAEVVHERDGYPAYLATDLRTFLSAPDALAAWVAEAEGQIIGHVALHGRTIPAAMSIAADALTCPADQLGVVARLLVCPDVRRRGVGRALLEVATQEARTLGRWPVLDVSDQFEPAVALYEHSGWVRAGQVHLELDGQAIEELVYLGPAPAE